jgi:ribulose-phosphate 3-epimerase
MPVFPIPAGRAPGPQKGKTAIAPSLLSADFFKLGEQIKECEAAGADWLHVDIMDGHFVPNLSFGPAIPASIKGKTALPMDVHLMVEKPSMFIEPFHKAGADLITIHIESADDTLAVIKKIKALGLPAGISIKPDTSPDKIKPYLDLIDMVLVMTVYPGFGGQGYLEEGHENMKAVRRLIDGAGRAIWLEVDGGVNAQTAKRALEAGADALVAGSAVFCAKEGIAQAIKNLR